MLTSDGGMAELVDALDSKSCGLRPCQFESDYPYQQIKPCQMTRLFLFNAISIMYRTTTNLFRLCDAICYCIIPKFML